MGRDFGDVLRALRQGEQCYRRGWNGKGQWIALAPASAVRYPLTMPFVYIQTVSCERVPWVASQADLLATDWEIIPDD